ncbi:MAG: flagellar basal body protein, partial [Granulosicoccaceae bacterium]
MAFGLGLSGLNAASSELNVTANNIANVGTTGFKYSRGEFYDVYAISVTASASTAIGDG